MPRFVDPTWDSGHALINASIEKLVHAWAALFGAHINAGYQSGHLSPGHTVTGTATDVVPINGWGGESQKRFEAGLALLAKFGFEVGYDGSVPGTLDWSDNSTSGVTGHGPPGQTTSPHAHIEWVGNGTHADARKRLAAALAAASQLGNGGLLGGTISLPNPIDAAKDAAGFVGDKALDLAKGIIGALWDAFGADGARILLYVVLVLGGTALALGGVSRTVGVHPSTSQALKGAA